MTTVTLRFQSTGQVPGDGRPVTMRGPSLTIGRGPGNDMVLPDPDRIVSSSHAVLENHNGNVVVVDLSANGTFLNFGKIPLGRTPTPLNSGDILSIGPYELVVEMSRPVAMIADPMADGPVGHGRAERAQGYTDLLDAPDRSGDFLDDLLGKEQPTGPGLFKADPDGIPEDESFGVISSLLDGPDPYGSLRPGDPGRTEAEANHHGSDLFFTPRAAASAIPDDWDDLLGPGPGAGAPPQRQTQAAPQPVPPSPAVAPPPQALAPSDDDPFGLGDEPDPAPSPVPAVPAQPAQAGAFDAVTAGSFSAQSGTVQSVPGQPPAGQPAAIPAEPFQSAPPVAFPAQAAAPAAQVQSAPAQPSAGAPASGLSDAETVRAFLRVLGSDHVVKDDDAHATMLRLGGVLKAMIVGIREILMTRTQFKGEFRIDQTMIAASGNNPLKFSVSPEQAIEALTKTGARGYLPAEAATEQALNDIRAHEVAMVTGMEAALKGVLSRLDPKALEEKLAQRGGGGLFSNKKAKYWELYEEMYAEISDQAENQFHALFAREFALAYKEQLERLK